MLERTITAAVGLGANLGDKAGQIRAALAEIDRLPETRLKAASRFYRTAPVGKTDQDWFVNTAALVDTRLPPQDLLHGLLEVERRLGRVRTEKWGPRRIDLDLLFYGSRVIEEEDLIVPHPFLHLRRFVLEPLAELAPDWIHPTLGLNVKDLTARIDPREQEVFLL